MHYNDINAVLTSMLQARTTNALIEARSVDRPAIIAKHDQGLRSIYKCSHAIDKMVEPHASKMLLWPLLERFCDLWEDHQEGIVTPQDLESESVQ